MTAHSSILACRIPWTEESGGLQSTGSRSQTRLKWLHTHTHIHKIILLSSVQSSCSVMSDSLQPHGLQHTRPPSPWPTPGVFYYYYTKKLFCCLSEIQIELGALYFIWGIFLKCYWHLVDLQCCVHFKWIAKWITHICTYILSFFRFFSHVGYYRVYCQGPMPCRGSLLVLRTLSKWLSDNLTTQALTFRPFITDSGLLGICQTPECWAWTLVMAHLSCFLVNEARKWGQGCSGQSGPKGT